MEILLSGNVFSAIRRNVPCTDRILNIFDKVKDSFAEIAIDDQKHRCNTCTCQKRKQNTFQNSSGTHHTSQCTKQFNISCTYHSENKQNDKTQRYYASHSKTAYFSNSLLPDTAKQSQKHGK